MITYNEEGEKEGGYEVTKNDIHIICGSIIGVGLIVGILFLFLT